LCAVTFFEYVERLTAFVAILEHNFLPVRRQILSTGITIHDVTP
jgi:hypothetical protein